MAYCQFTEQYYGYAGMVDYIILYECYCILFNKAVRSVAFSQSGKLVAVGANSGTLRLCSVPSLVENKPR